MSLDLIPVWVVFAAALVIACAALEAGYRIGKQRLRRPDYEKESSVSSITSVVFGFSAFMLAFTFSIVWERYDSKRALVREDAVAIRTAWKRSDFLPEAARTETAALLRQYVGLRINFAEARNIEPQHVKEAMAEAERIQDRMWNTAVANARLDMNSDVAALYIDSLNVMNGVHSSRVAIGIQARVPVEIWFVLYVITFLGMFGMGYQTGIAGSPRSMTWSILALTFALGFALTASLDRPDSGILNVSQLPLIDLQTSMAASETLQK